MSPSNLPLQPPRLEAVTMEPVNTEGILLDAGLLVSITYILYLIRINGTERSKRTEISGTAP